MHVLKKTLLSASLGGIVAAASFGALAQTFPDFTVNEGAVPDAIARTLTGDKITGNYIEVITFNGTGSGTFDVSLKWNAGQFIGSNGANPVNSQLGGGSENRYGLYALYTGSGSFSTSGSVTTFVYDTGGSLNMFLDPDADTTFTQPGNGATAFTTGNAGDDIAIGTGATVSGQGQLDPSLTTCSGSGATAGINCGNFGTTTSFALSADGAEYFTAPNPFYRVSFQSAELNNFSATGTQQISGSLDLIFLSGEGPVPVPEPASAALVALGLLGLGLSRRRRA